MRTYLITIKPGATTVVAASSRQNAVLKFTGTRYVSAQTAHAYVFFRCGVATARRSEVTQLRQPGETTLFAANELLQAIKESPGARMPPALVKPEVVDFLERRGFIKRVGAFRWEACNG